MGVKDGEDPHRPLVERVQSELPYGTASFNQLVRTHSGRVYGRAYTILRSRPDAEEAVQDVFVAVFRSLGRYRFERPFQHWLNVITLNSCRMILRKRASEQRRRSALKQNMLAPPTSQPTDHSLRTLLLELLDELDPGTRVPLIMHFVEGYTYREIAEELDLSESAAKMRISRGTRRLREHYEERTTNSSDREAE